jgi:hypothetical protein
MIGTREEWFASCRRPSREELGDLPRRNDEYEEVIHAG